MNIVLGYIMAFLVLAFSMLPCGDVAKVASGKASYELTQSIPEPGDGSHEDACSPFCICACCASFSVITRLAAAITITLPIQSSQSSYLPDRLHSIVLPIWQPPQLV
ncbi:DUF6660 family protein [Paracnuella aquatica]|uniref:DUF6660 family protein n=1 Tax=Paracnuella aquatica TaxID=2268757 RepID=UPI003BA8DE26